MLSVDSRCQNNSFPTHHDITMRRFAIANVHRTSAFAAVSSVALLTSFSCSEANNNNDVDDRFGQHRQESKLPMPWQQQWHALQKNKFTVREGNLLYINHGAHKSRLHSCNCEAALNHKTSSPRTIKNKFRCKEWITTT